MNAEQRRVDLSWVEKGTPSRWIQLPEKYQKIAVDLFSDAAANHYQPTRKHSGLPLVPNDGITAEVPFGEIAVMALGSTYLVPKTEIAIFVRQCIENVQRQPSNESGLVAIAVLGIIDNRLASGQAPIDVESARKLMRRYDQVADHFQLSKRIEDLFDFAEFSSLLMRTNWKKYDTSVWRRSYEE